MPSNDLKWMRKMDFRGIWVSVRRNGNGEMRINEGPTEALWQRGDGAVTVWW
jgi:hypothetical protein